MALRRTLGIVCSLALAAAIATGCGNAVPKDAICSVDGTAIKKSEFNRILDSAKKNYKSQGTKFPKKGTPEYKQLRNQAIDYLIEQKLYAQQAKELKVTVKKKDIDKRLKQLKESFFKGDKKAYAKELKKQGLTEKEVRENLSQQLLTEKLFEKVTKSVKVSEAKSKAYFEDNPTQYETPEQREVAHILVKGKADADKIYAQVKGGDEKVFAKLAKSKSQDPSSAQNGGVLTVSRGQTVPEFDKMAFDLKKGEVSKPVKTQFGYHVITARGDVTPKKKQEYKDVKQQIEQTLEQEQRSKRMQDWRDAVRKRAEKKVKCNKGYVWTQTVKSTESTPPATPQVPSEDKGDKGKGDKKDKGAKTSGKAKVGASTKDKGDK